MSEDLKQHNSLNEIGKQAAANYRQYEKFAAAAQKRNVSLGEAALAEVAALPPKSSANPKDGESWKDRENRFIQAKAKWNLESAAEHYREYQGAYHELGLIEAHLDGVPITVDEPVTIGEQIEVHHHPARAPSHTKSNAA